jgi:hypothetical protein
LRDQFLRLFCKPVRGFLGSPFHSVHCMATAIQCQDSEEG